MPVFMNETKVLARYGLFPLYPVLAPFSAPARIQSLKPFFALPLKLFAGMLAPDGRCKTVSLQNKYLVQDTL